MLATLQVMPELTFSQHALLLHASRQQVKLEIVPHYQLNSPIVAEIALEISISDFSHGSDFWSNTES